MSQALLDNVIQMAMTYLNDFGQKFWTKEQMQAFVAEAHREMQLELQINGIPVIKKKSAIATIPQINLSTWTGEVTWPNQSTTLSDLVEPIECWERPTGDTLESDWDLMIQKSWVPEAQPVNDLVYWNWVGEQIKFLGATVSNDVKLYYNAGIPIPQADEDPMGFLNAETFIAPKAASLAADSVGAKSKALTLGARADKMMDKILQANVLAEQNLPVRRRPYRHGRRPFLIR